MSNVLSNYASQYGLGTSLNFVENDDETEYNLFTFLQMYDNIYSSLVIVETALLEDISFSDGLDYILEFYYSFFKSLKEHGCRTMFICNTDESRFQENNKFLDYVDIHVNKDMFFLFIDSFFRELDEEIGTDSTILVVDQYFWGNDIFSSYGWFVESYLIPFARYKFNLSYSDYSDVDDVFNVCYGNGLNVIFLYGTDEFFSLHSDGYFLGNNQYLFDEMQNYSNIVTLQALTNFGENYYQRWISFFEDFDAYGLNSDDLYNYRYDYIPETEYTGGEIAIHPASDLKRFGTGLVFLRSMLNLILTDFIAGEDLSQYNNYPGRCDVTFKPVTQSDDAWVTTPSLSCFNLLMDDEELEFYCGII